MTPLDFLIIIAAVCLAAIVAAFVPLLWQIKKSIHHTEKSITNLFNELNPLVHSLAEITTELENITSSVNEKIDKADEILDTIKDASEIFLTTGNILKKSLVPASNQINAVRSGILAFINFIALKNRRKDNE
jgi:uncharacterized protein YoxC